MNKLLLSLSFILLFTFTGCATVYNPATGRNEFIAISTPEEVSMGQKMHGELKGQFKFSADTGKLSRVRMIGERVARVSDRQDYVYQFFLIEDKELNAFTTPGGYIYFNTGLYDRLTTDDQIASVLAHEIGHCAARHTVKKFQAALGYDLIGQLILSQVADEGMRQIAGLSSGALMSVIFKAYSRKDELESDRLGVKYMHLAGYELEAMIETFALLQKESKNAGMPAMLMTHPHLKDRIEAANKEIAKYQ